MHREVMVEEPRHVVDAGGARLVMRLERGDVVGRDALDGQAHRAALDDGARLEQVEHGPRVQREGEPERLDELRRAQLGHERALPVPRLEDVQVREHADGLAQRRAGDAELGGQLALGRQLAAGRQDAAQDRLLDPLDGLRRDARAADGEHLV